MVGQWRRGHSRLPLPYARAVAAAGARPKIYSTFEHVPTEDTPLGLEVVMGIDPDDHSALDGAAGVVLPGGGDIDPTLYGARPHPRTKNVSQRRDLYELTLLAEALRRDMPVLAICHGMQLLNVQLGGGLDQHLADQPARIEHDGGSPSPNPVHEVSVKPDSLLERIVGRSQIEVNSSHHQGLSDVPDELEEVAWAPDGVLEGVVSSEHTWVVGVQWHPEVMAEGHAAQRELFEAFVEATEVYPQRTLAGATARSA